MTKEKLIEMLQKLPEGIHVSICDIRKNVHFGGDDEGTYEGLYHDFKIDVVPKEMLLKGAKMFACLIFENEEYTEDGDLIEKEELKRMYKNKYLAEFANKNSSDRHDAFNNYYKGLKFMRETGFCPNCGIGINNDEQRLKFCQNCKDNWDDDEEVEFECCDNCDLPNACSDYGCAIKQGIKKDDEY